MNSTTYCPDCGRAGVVVALDGATLLETRPEIRRHACNIGGPGATLSTQEN